MEKTNQNSSSAPRAQFRAFAILYPLSSILYLLPLLPASGCNILGYAASAVAPDEQKDARYIPRPEPMVVIAENWRNPTGTVMDAEQIARFVYEKLRTNKVEPQIDPMMVIDLKSQRPDFRTMTIAQIGKEVGARQVIYINLTETSLTGAEGSDSLRGKVTARVKVVDVETGEARWPHDAAEGYPISISTPLATARDEREETALHEQLIQAASDRISRIFYKAPAEE